MDGFSEVRKSTNIHVQSLRTSRLNNLTLSAWINGSLTCNSNLSRMGNLTIDEHDVWGSTFLIDMQPWVLVISLIYASVLGFHDFRSLGIFFVNDIVA